MMDDNHLSVSDVDILNSLLWPHSPPSNNQQPSDSDSYRIPYLLSSSPTHIEPAEPVYSTAPLVPIYSTSTTTPSLLMNNLPLPSPVHIEFDMKNASTKTEKISKPPKKECNTSKYIRTCRKEGCTKSVQKYGLCHKHGGRRTCKYRDCDKKDRGNGFCVSHGGGKRCGIPTCSRVVRRSDLCATHLRAAADRRRQQQFPLA